MSRWPEVVKTDTFIILALRIIGVICILHLHIWYLFFPRYFYNFRHVSRHASLFGGFFYIFFCLAGDFVVFEAGTFVALTEFLINSTSEKKKT